MLKIKMQNGVARQKSLRGTRGGECGWTRVLGVRVYLSRSGKRRIILFYLLKPQTELWSYPLEPNKLQLTLFFSLIF